jgi:hypothetical protein
MGLGPGGGVSGVAVRRLARTCKPVVMAIPVRLHFIPEKITVTDEQLATLIDRTARRTADEVQVVVESLRGDIQIVADGVLRLTERQRAVEHSLDAVGGEVRELTARVDVSVMQLAERLERLESEQSTLARRVSRIEAHLGNGAE